MKLLVVEDDAALRGQLVEALGAAPLEAHGASPHEARSTWAPTVVAAGDGLQALALGLEQDFDAVVLDLGLPMLDGLGVLARWRRAGRAVPVLILTARDSWRDKVAGMDAGADDYLAKPFDLGELQARLRALLRRTRRSPPGPLRCGALTLDAPAGRAAVDGVPLALTGHEFRLLAALARRPGLVLPREALQRCLAADATASAGGTGLDTLLARLRRKLPPGLIETLPGAGYRLRVPT